MGRLKLAYYVVKKGRGYWQPTSRMRAQGFFSICCGADGPVAWAVAEEWNKRWQLHRRGFSPTSPSRAPRGSVSEAFDRFRQTDQWAAMAPRTREDWVRCHALIEPVFGCVNPRTIKFEHVDRFYAALRQQKGIDAAYRAIKHFRRLWVKMAAMGYCDRTGDPSSGLRRTNPQPRSQVWTYEEVRLLIKAAVRAGSDGLACIIAIAWDTQFSPGDVRGLTGSNLESHGDRLIFRIRRNKTGRGAIGTLSRITENILLRYLGANPPSADRTLFLHRQGKMYSKDTLTHEFARIRESVFPGDSRRLMDMRRSGAIEAAAGGVDPNALAAKMGNTINTSRQLQKTYQPVDIAAVSNADHARIVGRRRIREVSLSKFRK